MTHLSVNLNKVALLRNSRGRDFPSVLTVAKDIISMGAQGITLHPRPDQRHARWDDLRVLRRELTGPYQVELNVEGYPDDTYINLIEEIRPAQATLVPDPPNAITSNAGWHVSRQEADLRAAIDRLAKTGARISVFMDPKTSGESDMRRLRELGAHRIELYTEAWAEAFGACEFGEPATDLSVEPGPASVGDLADAPAQVASRYRQCAEWARSAGLGVNAGHDLNLRNLGALIREIPWISEVSIGHALTVEALYLGYAETLRRYREILKGGRS